MRCVFVPARAIRRGLTLCAACALALCLTLACGGSRPERQPALPEPAEENVLGPGDVFTLEIVGEKDLPKEYQVGADGSVDVPYVHTLRVAGLDAGGVARLVRQRLIEHQILSDPSVIVQIREVHSRRVTLLGQVAKPGSFELTPGLTLIQAVSLAGGLTAIADSDRVNLTRKLQGGGTRTVVLSVEAITEGRTGDVRLQAGDQIYVHERLF